MASPLKKVQEVLDTSTTLKWELGAGAPPRWEVPKAGRPALGVPVQKFACRNEQTSSVLDALRHLMPINVATRYDGIDDP